ncbi:MAG: hypothetical protein GYB64_09615 [Chloroflexi bacterium]|nr:hypothetical protein [Chloroflexota bacterium]
MWTLTVAERLIEDYQRLFPGKWAVLWDAFQTVQPRLGMEQYPCELYASHVKELLVRVMEGVDLAPATRSELLLTLEGMAPLNGDAARLHAQLQNAILGFQQDLPPETAPGAAARLAAELADRAGDPQRHQPDPIRWQALEHTRREVMHDGYAHWR